MLKKNKRRGYLYYNKSELIDVLIKSGLYLKLSRLQLSLHYLSEKIPRKKNPNYNFLKHVRNSPKKVEIRDIETDEITVYSSMYKAAKTFNQQSKLISAYVGKVRRNRYAIKVLTESD